jgi:hypothetical protein
MTRLRSLRMTDWRSIADAEITLLDGTPTLLYGENDAGKSNVLAAVESFCRLLSRAVADGHTGAGDTFAWVNPAAGMVTPDGAVELSHPIRYGATRAILVGSLLTDTGEQVTVRFDITLDELTPGEDRPTRKVEVAQFDGPVPASPPDVLRVGEGRAFHEEFLPDRRAPLASSPVSPDGTGAKLALFRCANHHRTDVRARFREDFKQLVDSSPFDLPELIVAVGDRLEIQVLVGDRPIEERGAGPQQWVLAAAMIATASPDIVLFEEPETNLSWKAQQRLVGMLQAVAGGRQVVVATHSPHLGNLAGDRGPWYRVQRDVGAGTTLESCSGVDTLWGEYRLSLETAEGPNDPRKLTLFPGNLIRLHDASVRHLGIAAGDVVVASLEPHGLVQLQSLDAWIADDDTSK